MSCLPGTGLIDDTRPQLGGDLELNGYKIITVANGDVIIIPHGTGRVGIGTESPQSLIHAVAAGTNDAILILEKRHLYTAGVSFHSFSSPGVEIGSITMPLEDDLIIHNKVEGRDIILKTTRNGVEQTPFATDTDVGSTTLVGGDATAVLSAQKGVFTGDWLPAAHLTYDLGIADLKWNNVYAGTITADTLTVGILTADTVNFSFTEGSVLFANSAGDISEDNANFFWDDSNNRLGLGTAAPAYPVDVDVSTTIVSGGEIGIDTVVTANPAATSSANYYASFSTADFLTNQNTASGFFVIGDFNVGRNSGTGTLQNVVGTWGRATNLSTGDISDNYGVVGQARNQSSGNITRNYGVLGISRNNGTGTITDGVGVYARIRNEDASGTVTNAYNLYVDNPSNIGTITNLYGLYIEDQTHGDNRWAIYQVGADDDSYFAGDVGIGIDTPDGTLHVHTATAGSVTANSFADDLVVENSGTGGISILTPNTGSGLIYFGDPESANNAGFSYSHATNALTFRVAEADRWSIDSNGDLIAAANNDKMFFGALQEASITYDGTDLLIDARAVGTGDGIFTGDWVPVANLTYDLGRTDKKWNNLYVGTLNADTVNFSFTEGSVLFADSAGDVAEDNAKFFWDDTTDRLGIGVATPTSPLSITRAETADNTAIDVVFIDLDMTGDVTTGNPAVQVMSIDFDLSGTETTNTPARKIAGFYLDMDDAMTLNSVFAQRSSYGMLLENNFTGTNTNVSTFVQYGLRIDLDGDIGTAGTTSKYGAFLDVTGGADNAYGLLVTNSVTSGVANYGLFINVVANGAANYGIWDASGADWILDGDSQKTTWGEDQDASIFFDATDFVIENDLSNSDIVFKINDDTVDTEFMRIDADVSRLGVLTATPDGTLHVHTATAGAVTANASGDDLVVENSVDGGISILTPNANSGWLMFGDAAANFSGGLEYDHSTDALTFYTGDAAGWSIVAAGDLQAAADSDLITFGDSQDYSITWDGSDAVHTIAAGDFVFTGGNVGIGIASPDGTLHVHTATAGSQTAHAFADDLVVENNTNVGITLLCPGGSSDARILFADPSSSSAGFINYDHGIDALLFGTNAVWRWTIESGGDLRAEADNYKIEFGDSQDYSITWDGSDAVHTIAAGDFVFTGGNVGIGTAAPTNLLHVNGGHARASGGFISGTDSEGITIGGAALNTTFKAADEGVTDLAQYVGLRSSGVNFGGAIVLGRSQGTIAAKTAVADGDILGQISAIGYDGTDFEQSTLINSEVDGTPSAGVMPGRIVFKTSPVGSASPAERMRIDSAGLVGINIADPDGTLHVHTATAGSVTANAIGDDLVVENSADGGISILTPNANSGWLMFGDAAANFSGGLEYDHSTDALTFYTGDAAGWSITSAGDLQAAADGDKIRFGEDQDASIFFDATDFVIENDLSNSDIIFKVNDGGVDTEMIRIDGSESQVIVGGTPATAYPGRLHAVGSGATPALVVSDDTATLTGTNFYSSKSVVGLNPGTTTVASIIEGGPNRHVCIDVRANDNADTFCVRTSTAQNGVVDRIAFSVKPSGWVGIGSDVVPAEILEIEDNNSDTTIQISNTATTGDPQLAFALSGSKKFTMGVDDSDGDKFKIGTTAVSTNPRLTIDSSGQFGIGTQSPGSLLEVQASVGNAGTLTLSTAETTVVDGDILGQIDFQAPNESDGADSILVGASIWAEADSTFSATSNATELVFATAFSETAAEKMRLDSTGQLGIGTSTPTARLHIVETTDDISNLALLIEGNNRGTAAAGDEAYMSLQLDNDAGTPVEAARLTWEINTVTAASEDGEFRFGVMDGGSLSDKLTINETGVTVSDDLIVSAAASVTFTGFTSLTMGGTFINTPDEITATSAGVAASVATVNTEVTTNGDSDLDNVTLANGTSGQIKHIYCVVEGNAADTWKITPATMVGGTQITFAGVGEGCTLIYADSEGWVVVANNGGTIT